MRILYRIHQLQGNFTVTISNELVLLQVTHTPLKMFPRLFVFAMRMSTSEWLQTLLLHILRLLIGRMLILMKPLTLNNGSMKK